LDKIKESTPQEKYKSGGNCSQGTKKEGATDDQSMDEASDSVKIQVGD
jgi:hypothetical protein